MEDESHKTHQSERVNGIDFKGGRFHDERNDLKREEGIVEGITVGSLSHSKSANKSRDRIVEEGI